MLFAFTNVTGAKGEIIGIKSLSIDQLHLSAYVAVADMTFPHDGTSPSPLQYIMGEYSTIVSTDEIDIYFSNNYGNRPTGTVNTVANTIDVDFGSLRLNLRYDGYPYPGLPYFLHVNDNVSLWDGTKNITSHYYNPLDGSFSLEWTGSTPVNGTVNGGSVSTDADYYFLLSGKASTVPIPGAIWLFGSGLSALAFFRKKVAKYPSIKS